jgi:hypothetical protein
MEKVIRDILQRELWQHGTKNDPWLSLERGSPLYSAGCAWSILQESGSW